jgi:hypothetical protein
MVGGLERREKKTLHQQHSNEKNESEGESKKKEFFHYGLLLFTIVYASYRTYNSSSVKL